jgi:hypothetical protein
MRHGIAKAALLVSAICAVSVALGAEATHVTLTTLATHANEFLGRRITTRGCLVDTLQHGVFIEPCGTSDWRYLLLLDIPVKLQPPETYEAGRPFGEKVEADFSGKLMVEKVDFGDSTVDHIILRVDKVSNVVLHEP